MNEKLKEKLFDIFIYFVAGYILINWTLALLLFCYEFIIGPINNAATKPISPVKVPNSIYKINSKSFLSIFRFIIFIFFYSLYNIFPHSI